MTPDSLLLRTSIVLHRPIYPRNIGMCARVMGNLGCQDLHIIAPRCDWSSSMVQHEARQGATHSGDILTNAALYDSELSFFESHGQGVKIAFSARDGAGKRISEFAELLTSFKQQPQHPVWHDKTQIQLHFGTEDDGLTLQELEQMNFICRLPTRGTHTSFNLSHAVLLAIFILDNEIGETQLKTEVTESLPPGRLEYPRKAIRSWIEALGFDLGTRNITIETSLNRVLLGNCPSPDDVRLLEKVLFQTVEKLNPPKLKNNES